MLVSSWIKRVGEEDAQIELFTALEKEYSSATINNWKNGNAHPPMPVIQFVLNNSNVKLELDEEPFADAQIFIGTPSHRGLKPHTVVCVEVLRYKYKSLGFLAEFGSSLHLVRNRLIEKFLKTKGEWLLALDDDMVPPIGYPAKSAQWGAKFDKQFNAVDVLERLMSHRRTYVSALYFDRNGQGIPMYSAGRNNPSVAAQDRRGPRDEVKAVDWVGGGCSLIHRSVFEDILEKCPDIRAEREGQPNGWYNPLPHAGEDVSFSIRAKESGHQPYLDYGCIAGHIGEIVFWNEQIR